MFPKFCRLFIFVITVGFISNNNLIASAGDNTNTNVSSVDEKSSNKVMVASYISGSYLNWFVFDGGDFLNQVNAYLTIKGVVKTSYLTAGFDYTPTLNNDNRFETFKMFSWLEGKNIGKLIMGNEEGAGYLLSYTGTSEGFIGNQAYRDSFFLFNDVGLGVADILGKITSYNSAKITYISPKFEGLQFGLSFDFNANKRNSLYSSSFEGEEAYEAAIKYDTLIVNRGLNIGMSAAFRLVSDIMDEYAMGIKFSHGYASFDLGYKKRNIRKNNHYTALYDFSSLAASLSWVTPRSGLGIYYANLTNDSDNKGEKGVNVYEFFTFYTFAQGLKSKLSVSYYSEQEKKAEIILAIGISLDF